MESPEKQGPVHRTVSRPSSFIIVGVSTATRTLDGGRTDGRAGRRAATVNRSAARSDTDAHFLFDDDGQRPVGAGRDDVSFTVSASLSALVSDEMK